MHGDHSNNSSGSDCNNSNDDIAGDDVDEGYDNNTSDDSCINNDKNPYCCSARSHKMCQTCVERNIDIAILRRTGTGNETLLLQREKMPAADYTTGEQA